MLQYVDALEVRILELELEVQRLRGMLQECQERGRDAILRRGTVPEVGYDEEEFTPLEAGEFVPFDEGERLPPRRMRRTGLNLLQEEAIRHRQQLERAQTLRGSRFIPQAMGEYKRKR